MLHEKFAPNQYLSNGIHLHNSKIWFENFLLNRNKGLVVQQPVVYRCNGLWE